MDKVQEQFLPLFIRLYIYALHGYFVEVTFTAVWDLIAAGDPRLQGHSSIWSLAIYGTCGLVLEKLSTALTGRGVPLIVRAIIYVLLIYFWEFTSGAILRLVSACPWDYTEFQYNFKGLITLEYAPFWLITGLITEMVFMNWLHRLRWVGNHKVVHSQMPLNGYASTNGIIKTDKKGK